MNSDTAVEALAALAQGHRLAIFRLLVQKGPVGLPAGAISELLSIQPATLSFHLSQLSHAGLITSTRTGRSIAYRANYQAMERLLSYLTENCCEGKKCIDEKATRSRSRKKC